MESPALGDGHAGFGERPGETDRRQHWHHASGRLNRATPFGLRVSLSRTGRALSSPFVHSLNLQARIVIHDTDTTSDTDTDTTTRGHHQGPITATLAWSFTVT